MKGLTPPFSCALTIKIMTVSIIANNYSSRSVLFHPRIRDRASSTKRISASSSVLPFTQRWEQKWFEKISSSQKREIKLEIIQQKKMRIHWKRLEEESLKRRRNFLQGREERWSEGSSGTCLFAVSLVRRSLTWPLPASGLVSEDGHWTDIPLFDINKTTTSSNSPSVRCLYTHQSSLSVPEGASTVESKIQYINISYKKKNA